MRVQQARWVERSFDGAEGRQLGLGAVEVQMGELGRADAVVTIEVARRVGVVLHGVGMPGHFLVGTPDPEVFIDAFMRLGQTQATLGRPDRGARTLEAAAGRFAGNDADHLANAAVRLRAQLN